MASRRQELPPGLGIDPPRPPLPPPHPPAAPASGIDPNASLCPAKQTQKPKGAKVPSRKRIPDTQQELFCPTVKLPRASQSSSASGGRGFGDSLLAGGGVAAGQAGRGRSTCSLAASGRAANLQHATGGAASSQHATGGVTNLQPAAGGAPSSQPASEVNPVLQEAQVIERAIDIKKQFLEKISGLLGAPEYRLRLKELIKATETNFESFQQKIQNDKEREARREAKQREAASAKKRSLDAAAENERLTRQAQDLTRQAQEARARSEAAAGNAKKLEQERAAIGDSSSREGTPEAGPSTR
jgi:hypothetical protein